MPQVHMPKRLLDAQSLRNTSAQILFCNFSKIFKKVKDVKLSYSLILKNILHAYILPFFLRKLKHNFKTSKSNTFKTNFDFAICGLNSTQIIEIVM